jgi:hypothetical protein
MTLSAAEVKYRHQPVELMYVHEMYHPGVFGEFDDSVYRRIAELRASETKLNLEKVRFFEYLLDIVDRKKFADLQDRYLAPPIKRGCLKYIDPTSWFEHKFAFAHSLGLHERKNLRLLDLGTGAGHFMVIAQFYGHSIVGTDLPSQNIPDDPAEFYDALAAIYGVTRIRHRIEPNTPLTGLPRGLDLVTAFSVAFNRNGERLWDTGEWRFFLSDLRKNFLGETPALFMTLMTKKLEPEVWDFLKDRSSFVDERRLYVLLEKFD